MVDKFTVIESARNRKPRIFELLGITEWLYDPDGPYYTAHLELTPELAKLLQAPEIAHSNRDRSPTVVNKLADDMRAGMFGPYCSMFSFAGEVMTDAFHRDEAVALSETTQRFVIVVRPEDDPGIFDQQHKRSFSESEAMKATTLEEIPKRKRGPIGTALVIHRVWAGVSLEKYRIVSDQQKEHHFHADAEETLQLHRVREMFREATFKPLPVEATAGWAGILEHDRARANAFVLHFETAEKQKEGDPCYRLYRWLHSRVAAKTDRTSAQSFYNAVVFCYDAWCGGRSAYKIDVPSGAFLTPKGE